MPSHDQISVKKLFLYALIGSVSVSALLGILAILIGDFGEFEVRVLLTSLTISGASLCGLSCGAALEANRARELSLAGIGLSVLAALLIIGGIWTEPESEVYWKTAATIAIFAASCSHMALLLLARLAPQYAWAPQLAFVAVFGVALILTWMIWGEIEADMPFRLLGVAAIVDAAISLMIPVFHRLSRSETESPARHERVLTLSEINHEISQLHSRLDELEKLRRELSAL
jgi:hypothetical protein